MKNITFSIITTLLLVLSLSTPVPAVEAPPEDPGWPRLVKANDRELVIYQPQVDYWTDYKILHFRCAISVKKAKNAEEKFGVAEMEADTVVDQENRIVALLPKMRLLRFPNTSDAEESDLRQIVEELYPRRGGMTISLDRILPYLDPAKQAQQQAVQLNLDPPKIFYSSSPAILVMFMGEPQLQPVVKDKNELLFAVNTNWNIFFDATAQRYYLLSGEHWLTATDALKGPWMQTTSLPRSLSSLPADDNWKDVRARIPAKLIANPPAVFISTEPAELILTQGEPTFSPITGTRLMRVANTELPVFLNSADRKYYLLTAGRWFRAGKLKGPWSSASTDLPADFARIPDDNPAAFVKASVPGTTEAKDAVLLASIPTRTVTTLADPPAVQVTYDGQPKFQTIESTTVQYAVNSPNAVFLVSGSYYCCNEGVWFVSPSATGPWTLCTSVPSVIYSIPSSHPAHNVTYVVVENTTPTTVVYTQTSGYSGEYVATNGVLMFGIGMLTGALIADNHYHHYPMHYSYGWGARYDYHYGGYYGGARVAYGPYAGRGASVAYNPRTGTYSRGAYASGPYGSASAHRAYNPYTGTSARAARVDTAYGSAGRAAAYNPYTGNAARGGYRSTDRGTVGAVQTNRGTGAVGVQSNVTGAGAAAWDTRNGQGAVARDRQGNVYAGRDGNVYKKDSSGSWSSNSGNNWQSTSRPQQTRDLNRQSQARSRGNQAYRGGGGGGARRR